MLAEPAAFSRLKATPPIPNESASPSESSNNTLKDKTSAANADDATARAAEENVMLFPAASIMLVLSASFVSGLLVFPKNSYVSVGPVGPVYPVGPALPLCPAGPV